MTDLRICVKIDHECSIIPGFFPKEKHFSQEVYKRQGLFVDEPQVLSPEKVQARVVAGHWVQQAGGLGNGEAHHGLKQVPGALLDLSLIHI